MNALLQAFSRGIALAWLLFALSGAAHGHAVVVETSPSDGALLRAAPDRIVVRFNEPVTPVSAQVLNAAGEGIISFDAVSMEGDALRIALPPTMANGSYVASYRVISADSHPVAGSIVFSVGSVSERMTATMGAADDRGWRAAMVTVRAILYAGILGGAGGVLFLLLVRPAGYALAAARRIAAVLSTVGSLAALIAIGIHGGLLIGGPAGSLADPDTWRIGLASGFGTTAVAAFVGLVLVAASLHRDWPAGLRRLAYVGAGIALASFALSGHIVSAGPRWITVPAVVTHTAAVALWVGSLLPLHQAITRSGADAAGTVQRFSRVAVGAVAALVVAGLIIAVLQVQGFRALIATTYGQLLLGKLALVTALIVLAIVNKVRLTPALAEGDASAATALRRIIAAEIALAAGILMVTAMLGTTVPPRVLAGAAEFHAGHVHTGHERVTQELSVTIVGPGGTAEVVLASDNSGPNDARIRLLDSAGAPLNALEVDFTAANPSAGVEAIRRAAVVVEPGTWQVEELLLVPTGSWTLQIDVLISDFETTRFETVVTLR